MVMTALHAALPVTGEKCWQIFGYGMPRERVSN